ncbi:hypothetical protein [Sorangium sp. So ce887]|uniref:hypothetical protein n=1 Tax=Sorangium sp. So ce887 TaxID=3133324 RepID=UPI003F5DD50D
MNLVLLVEGAETEPKVYQAWLRHRLPALLRAANVADPARAERAPVNWLTLLEKIR